MIHTIQLSSELTITADLPLSAVKMTVDVLDCNSFKDLCSYLEMMGEVFLET